MGFLSNLVSATVKTVLTPVAVVKDAFDVVVGDEPNNTKKILESVSDDLEDAADDLGNGELL